MRRKTLLAATIATVLSAPFAAAAVTLRGKAKSRFAPLFEQVVQ